MIVFISIFIHKFTTLCDNSILLVSSARVWYVLHMLSLHTFNIYTHCSYTLYIHYIYALDSDEAGEAHRRILHYTTPTHPT